MELGKLKRMDADLALENRALKDLLEKNFREAGETGSDQVHGRDPRIVDLAELSQGYRRSGRTTGLVVFPFNKPALTISNSRTLRLQSADLKHYNQPMSDLAFYPRYIERRLIEALEDSPVVLIQGPRQCGKTTLAHMVCAPQHLTGIGDRLNRGGHPPNVLTAHTRDYTYISFDDDVARDGAEADPMGFVAGLPERVILDEIQRVPALFTALKMEVDRQRVPGRFVLTGSTNVLRVPTIQDSLAGRLEVVRLHPLAQDEIAGQSPPVVNVRQSSGFLDALFGSGFKIQRTERLGTPLCDRIVAGGYPAALARPPGRRRANWYRNYLDAQIQRDVRNLARISTLEALPRLLALAAAQTAHLLNVSDLAAPFQLSRPTVQDYVALLERVFLLERLSPWHSNRLSRLVKTPKLHIGDTGLACALLGVDAAALAADRTLLGQLLETFVFQELRRQASWHEESFTFFHYRDRDKMEVDVVIERGTQAVAGMEVKAGATVTQADLRGLRKLKAATGRRFAGGAVVYDGETCVRYDDKLYAVPLRLLWETPVGAP
ncbi:MAG: ATP-binding protein [Nitrospira sp.]|nr:ATP-binding protein [Nitrospira sp.]